MVEETEKKEPSEPKRKRRDAAKQAFVDAVLAWQESMLGAVRTAGALLVGNSFLIYYGVLGPATGTAMDRAAVFSTVFWPGVYLIAGASMPLTAISKLFKHLKEN